jgi:hypothetical protein
LLLECLLNLDNPIVDRREKEIYESIY